MVVVVVEAPLSSPIRCQSPSQSNAPPHWVVVVVGVVVVVVVVSRVMVVVVGLCGVCLCVVCVSVAPPSHLARDGEEVGVPRRLLLRVDAGLQEFRQQRQRVGARAHHSQTHQAWARTRGGGGVHGAASSFMTMMDHDEE